MKRERETMEEIQRLKHNLILADSKKDTECAGAYLKGMIRGLYWVLDRGDLR